MSILARIRAKNGDVIRDQWRLSLKRGQLKDTDIAWIKSRWPDVCREAWPEFDDFEERAAIREFCGGQERAEAEAAAYAEVMGC